MASWKLAALALVMLVLAEDLTFAHHIRVLHTMQIDQRASNLQILF